MEGAKQVQVLKAHTKQARKLVFTGIMPRIYGLSVMGAPPTAIRKSRAAMNMGLGITKAGGCTYTALKMHNFDHKDPALVLPLNTISEFVQAIGGSRQQMILQSIWGDLVKELQADGRRWSKVKGSVSAAIATLLDLNWFCEHFNKWKDFEGTGWEIDYNTPFGSSALREVISHTIAINLQSAAADHIHSFGSTASAL